MAEAWKGCIKSLPTPRDLPKQRQKDKILKLKGLRNWPLFLFSEGSISNKPYKPSARLKVLSKNKYRDLVGKAAILDKVISLCYL
ncbi:MAG TPA: hypothetical protein DEP99_02230 [Nitrospiraceae bacterium]|nr:hypothetical protein [Nitrospiraceae bacterium]